MSPAEWTTGGEWIWLEPGTTHQIAVTWNPPTVPRMDALSRVLRMLHVRDRQQPAFRICYSEDEAYQIFLDGTSFP